MFTQNTVNINTLSFAVKNEIDKVHIDKVTIFFKKKTSLP